MTQTQLDPEQVDLSQTVTLGGAEILTNKRVPPRTTTQVTTSSLTPEIDTYSDYVITLLASNLTINNQVTSTPQHGEILIIEITNNSTIHTITHGTLYVAKCGVPFPLNLPASKRMTLGYRWCSDISKWNLFMVAPET